ncbi:hypothetical protein PoB_007413500 [Plakobranchus ocellatus]|uniref:Uncharacterized protein n=1 Tax=Plakobranchus ocellatus TaxID=259542 RepID=A0AAV4DUI0_9GAST|nr:hypothetical protein PoB_007413500 [Plakobranchus ocellatus]
MKLPILTPIQRYHNEKKSHPSSHQHRAATMTGIHTRTNINTELLQWEEVTLVLISARTELHNELKSHSYFHQHRGATSNSRTYTSIELPQ